MLDGLALAALAFAATTYERDDRHASCQAGGEAPRKALVAIA